MRLFKKGEHGWEDEYFASTEKERRQFYAAFLERKHRIDVKDELRALVEVYAHRGVRQFSQLEVAERIALTAAYIGQIPTGEKDDIVTDLRGIELPDEISKAMGQLAAELMFPNGQNNAAKKFLELLVGAIVSYCEDGVQDEFDIVHSKFDAI